MPEGSPWTVCMRMKPRLRESRAGRPVSAFPTRTPRRGRALLCDSRKEVIQPQVPLRLPCYDFAPVTNLAFGRSLPRVGSRTSGTTGFHGVTGGVYKARERIHRVVADTRLLAIPTSCSRVADYNPNLGRFFGICSTSRYRCPLYRSLYYVCSPEHKGHTDLTSSPPSPWLSQAVSLESPPLRAGN